MIGPGCGSSDAKVYVGKSSPEEHRCGTCGYPVDKRTSDLNEYLDHCYYCSSNSEIGFSDTDRWEAKVVKKETEGKPAMHLLNKEFLDEVAQVRMYGNIKYPGEESWRVDTDMAYLDAAMRHLQETMEAFKRNDPSRLFDQESGRLHLGSTGANIMFVTTRIMERYAAGENVLGKVE